MTKHTPLACLFLVTSILTFGCSDPASDSGSGGGTALDGTGSGGAPGSGGVGSLPPLGEQCGVSDDREVVIRGQWVTGELPEPLGGPVQSGVYDLTAYQGYTYSTDLPDDVYLGFSAQNSGVIAFGSDGTFRAIQSDATSASAFTGQFSTSGVELTLLYVCPAGISEAPRPYTATASTVHLYDGIGAREYVFTRRPD